MISPTAIVAMILAALAVALVVGLTRAAHHDYRQTHPRYIGRHRKVAARVVAAELLPLMQLTTER